MWGCITPRFWCSLVSQAICDLPSIDYLCVPSNGLTFFKVVVILRLMRPNTKSPPKDK